MSLIGAGASATDKFAMGHEGDGCDVQEGQTGVSYRCHHGAATVVLDAQRGGRTRAPKRNRNALKTGLHTRAVIKQCQVASALLRCSRQLLKQIG
jgi:hypothetical protein